MLVSNTLPVAMNRTAVQDTDYVLSRWETFLPLPGGIKIGILIIMYVTLTAGFIGNTIVLILFSKYRSLRTTSNMFVINLTVADLLMCIKCLPLILRYFLSESLNNDRGYLLCNMEAFLGAYSGFVSILSLVALAVERCYVISRHIPIALNDNKTTAYIAIITIWIISGGGALTPLLGFGKYVEDGSRMFCTFDFFTRSDLNIAYNLTIQVVYFGIPVITIVTCYVIIFLHVRSHEKKYFKVRHTTNGAVNEIALRRMRKSRNCKQKELKTARSVSMLISVFCMSWLPYSIVGLIALYGDSSLITPLTATIPAIFAKLSTILNPVLYALLHKRFKQKLGAFAIGCFGKTNSNDTSHSDNKRRLYGLTEHPDYNTIRTLLQPSRPHMSGVRRLETGSSTSV